MTFASLSGVFSSVTESGLTGNLVMALFYTAIDLTLSAELLGDGSGDANVNADDYTLWADGFGTPEPSYDDGNYSQNGVVGPEDYTLSANDFGLRVSAHDGAQALAEPVAPSIPRVTPVAPELRLLPTTAVPEP